MTIAGHMGVMQILTIIRQKEAKMLGRVKPEQKSKWDKSVLMLTHGISMPLEKKLWISLDSCKKLNKESQYLGRIGLPCQMDRLWKWEKSSNII